MYTAIIGGTGLYPLQLENVEEQTIATPYGEALVQSGSYNQVPLVFLRRHGPGHSIPPHRVNYRANIWALKQLGITHILATNAVGSVNPDMQIGHYAIVDQFLDFTKSRDHTFFDGEDGNVFHPDVTAPYCQQLGQRLQEQARQLGMKQVHESACYVCTEGPRYETAAEIRMFARLGGDLVGMTGVPEVVLAREAGICYGTIALITNMGAGIDKGTLHHEDVVAVFEQNIEQVRSLVLHTAACVDNTSCECPEGGVIR